MSVGGTAYAKGEKGREAEGRRYQHILVELKRGMVPGSQGPWR